MSRDILRSTYAKEFRACLNYKSKSWAVGNGGSMAYAFSYAECERLEKNDTDFSIGTLLLLDELVDRLLWDKPTFSSRSLFGTP